MFTNVPTPPGWFVFLITILGSFFAWLAWEGIFYLCSFVSITWRQ